MIDMSTDNRTSSGPWLILVLSLGALAAVVSRCWIDLPIARWCWFRHYGISDLKYPKFAQEIFGFLEGFGDYPGVIIVAVLIFEWDRRHRMRLLHFFATILSTSLAVNIVKLFVVRRRPQGFRFLDPDFVTQYNVLSIDWTPWTSTIKSLERSFPSGHTATAFAMFAVLSLFYPEGKRAFLLLAVLVGIQRIMVCAHFPSDVIVGAMIGLLIGRTLSRVGIRRD